MAQVKDLPEFEMFDLASCAFSRNQKDRLCAELQVLSQVHGVRVVNNTLRVTVDMGQLTGRTLTNAYGVLQTKVNAIVNDYWEHTKQPAMSTSRKRVRTRLS